MRSYHQAHSTAIVIRPVKDLNNPVEQDHRTVTRVTRPRLGFKPFDAAPCPLTGMKLMYRLRKDQLEEGIEQGLTPAQQFSSLAA